MFIFPSTTYVSRRSAHIRPPHRRMPILLAALALLLATLLPGAARATGPRPAADHAVFLPLVQVTSKPVVSGLPFDPYSTRSGQATFYGADGSGNCSFDASPNDLMVAAMNETDYGNSWLCGASVQITGPKGTVVVRITDRCPECPSGNIDMSAEAFAKIANPVDGRVSITWKLVDSGISSAAGYHFKEGSSQWWTAVQIRNHRTPVWSVEYLSSAGSYQALTRERYNYFIAQSGMGTGPYTFRVTDIFGRTISDSSIALSVSQTVSGSSQFPAMP